MSNKSEDEVVIEAKPQTSKKTKFDAKSLFSLKNIPVFLSLVAMFFMLLGAFILICGGTTGVLAMTGIATIINIGAIGTLVAYFICEKRISFEVLHIVVALSLLANIITIF